jgi:aspartyl/asparaginyl beta-hydroxylase (cupin superfamily)
MRCITLTCFIILLIPILTLVLTGLRYSTSQSSDTLWINAFYSSILPTKSPLLLPRYKRDLDKHFKSNWKEIRSEFLSYTTKAPPLNNYTNMWNYTGWGTIPLSIYNKPLPTISTHFPLTLNLANAAGPSVVSVMFSVLQPGGSISPHTGDFKGIARYHLGLEVPTYEGKEWRRSEFLPDGGLWAPVRLGIYGKGTLKEVRDSVRGGNKVDDVEVMEWTEGESILWDDTFPHFAENLTKERRVVLFVDVVRGDLPRWARWVTRWVVRGVGPRIPLVEEWARWNEIQWGRHNGIGDEGGDEGGEEGGGNRRQHDEI